MALALDTVITINNVVDACDGYIYSGGVQVPCVMCLRWSQSGGNNSTFLDAYSMASGHALISSTLTSALNSVIPVSIMALGQNTTIAGGSDPIIYMFADSGHNGWAYQFGASGSVGTSMPATAFGTYGFITKRPGVMASPSGNFNIGSSSSGASLLSLGITNSDNTLNCYVHTGISTWSAVENSSVLPYQNASDTFSCVSTKWQPDVDSSGGNNVGNDRVFVGSVSGMIYEMEVSGTSTITLVKSLRHQVKTYPLSNAYASIINMAYLNGFLLVSDSYGFISLYEWESGELLQREMAGVSMSSTNAGFGGASIAFGTPNLCKATSLAYPTVLMSSSGSVSSQGSTISQLDIFRTPMQQQGQYLCHLNDVSAMGGGISNGSGGRTWWLLQGSNSSGTFPASTYLHFITETGFRSTSPTTISLNNGSPAAGEVTILDDPSQPSSVVFATTVPPSGLIIPTSGTDRIWAARIGKGENTQVRLGRG